MSERNFMQLLKARWAEGKFLCVGLDSDTDSPKFPEASFAGCSVPAAQWSFNRRIVEATHDLVCAIKPNLAFYRGVRGKEVLKKTIAYINEVAPEVPVILDAKQGDIGSTNDGYVAEDFGFYGADAVTVHPYLGMEAMKPFLDRADKGIIVLCRTSNPGAGEFQDLPLTGGFPLYNHIAWNVSRQWNYNGNCAVVVGATTPGQLAKVRQIVGDGFPILIPGIGAQGGEVEATVRAGQDSRGEGMIINSSRGIIFTSSGGDFAEAARAETSKLHDAITSCLVAA